MAPTIQTTSAGKIVAGETTFERPGSYPSLSLYFGVWGGCVQDGTRYRCPRIGLEVEMEFQPLSGRGPLSTLASQNGKKTNTKRLAAILTDSCNKLQEPDMVWPCCHPHILPDDDVASWLYDILITRVTRKEQLKSTLKVLSWRLAAEHSLSFA